MYAQRQEGDGEADTGIIGGRKCTLVNIFVHHMNETQSLTALSVKRKQLYLNNLVTTLLIKIFYPNSYSKRCKQEIQ